MRSFIGNRHVSMGDMAEVKVLKNALFFVMGYLVEVIIWLPWKHGLRYFVWCMFLYDT